MKPNKHVMMVKVELDRKFFTRHGLHMNNVGKERLALKIANVVTTILQKQTEDSISLCWKNEPDDSVSDSSKEDNIITNVEASINDVTQEESIDKDNGTIGN